MTVAAYNGEAVTVTGRVEIQESYFRARGITFSGGDGTNPLFYVQQHSGVPASHVEIDQCVVENSAADGVFLEGNASAATRVDDFQMHRSIVRDNGTDTSLEHGFYPKWATNWVVSDCLFYGNAAAQVHIGNASDGGILANSTLVSEGGIEAAVIWSEATGERSDNNRIVNCILYQKTANKDTFETTWGGGTAGTGNVIDQTIAYGASGTGVNFNTSAGGVTLQQTSTSDPQFVDATSDDYRVLSGSPAAGYSDLAYESLLDLNGDSRATGVIGAYGVEVVAAVLGSSAVTLTVTPVSSGVRTAYGVSAVPVVVAAASSGFRRLAGASAVAVLVAASSSAVRVVIGVSAVPVVVGFTSSSSLIASGVSAANVVVSPSTSGVRETFGVSGVALDASVAASAVLARIGVAAMPIVVAPSSSARLGRFAVSDCDLLLSFDATGDRSRPGGTRGPVALAGSVGSRGTSGSAGVAGGRN